MVRCRVAGTMMEGRMTLVVSVSTRRGGGFQLDKKSKS